MTHGEDGVTVIICCYNSASTIIPTLEHLQKQVTNLPWELVLVDNACTDDTVDIVKKTWNRLQIPHPLRIVFQPEPGLTNARHMGVNEAYYEFIVFCDDDNWLSENYIQTAFSLLQENKNAGLLGGQSKGVTEGEFPDWFSKYERGYAVGVPYNEPTQVNVNGVWGAGMVGRKTVFQKAMNDEIPMLCIGRSGADLTSGEDGEICLRTVLAGYDIMFEPSLTLTHFIAPNRLTEKYRDTLYAKFAPAYNEVMKYQRLIEVLKLSEAKKIIRFFFHFLKLVYATIINSDSKKQYNRQYLFFLSGIDLYGDSGCRRVLQFYNSVKK